MVEFSGAYFAALSSTLNRTCSNSTASRSTIGISGDRSSSTRWPERIFPARRNALPTISRRSCGDMFRTSAPDSSFVMSSRLAMNRLSRSDSSTIVVSNSLFCASLRLAPRSRMVPAEPRIAASGVFRSCEMDVSKAERSLSVSMVRLARSMSSTRCTRSIASAPWSISASSSRRWSGVSKAPCLSLSMPMMPTMPRLVRIGRNRRLAPGKVSEPRPAGRLLSNAHLAAAMSASCNVSSGG